MTVNQVLATAALRAGLEVEALDQTGLSQKAGPVVGHLRFASGSLEPANRLTPGSAGCVLGFDLLTLAEDRNLLYADQRMTTTIVSTSRTPTGSMVYDPSVEHPDEAELLARVDSASSNLFAFDALRASECLFGNTLAANFLVVGAAYQAGALRIPAESIREAIRINGTAVSANLDAFEWGRAAVATPEMFSAATDPQPQRTSAPRLQLPPAIWHSEGLQAVVARRAESLIDFQNRALAEDYLETVGVVAKAEARFTSSTTFTEAVARNLYKLTAYKDEYEVARLLTDRAFIDTMRETYPEGRLAYMLHPPALRALGLKKKIRMGPRAAVTLSLLARLKFLRGTPVDPFGRMQVRRIERVLRDHYRDLVLRLATDLGKENYEDFVHIASLPDMVRGYETVKMANVERYVAALKAAGVSPPSIDIGT